MRVKVACTSITQEHKLVVRYIREHPSWIIYVPDYPHNISDVFVDGFCGNYGVGVEPLVVLW
jgi:hypothetical protein